MWFVHNNYHFEFVAHVAASVAWQGGCALDKEASALFWLLCSVSCENEMKMSDKNCIAVLKQVRLTPSKCSDAYVCNKMVE